MVFLPSSGLPTGKNVLKPLKVITSQFDRAFPFLLLLQAFENHELLTVVRFFFCMFVCMFVCLFVCLFVACCTFPGSSALTHFVRCSILSVLFFFFPSSWCSLLHATPQQQSSLLFSSFLCVCSLFLSSDAGYFRAFESPCSRPL